MIWWIGHIFRTTTDAEPTVRVALIPLDEQQFGPTQADLRAGLLPTPSQVARQYPAKLNLTFWPYIRVGMVCHDQQLFWPGITGTSASGKVDFGCFQLAVSVPRDLISWTINPRSDDQNRPPGAHLPGQLHRLSSAYHQHADTAVVQLTTGPDELIVSCFELARFYLQGLSTPILRAIVDADNDDFLQVDTLHAFLDPSLTSFVTDGIFRTAFTSSGLVPTDAYLLARLWLDPLARRQVANIGSSLLKNRSSEPEAEDLINPLRVGFPFEGQTTLTFNGVRCPNKRGGFTYLIYNIESCTHPMPYAGLRLFVDPRSIIRRVPPPPSSEPPNRLAPRKARTITHTVNSPAPNRYQPVRFETGSLLEMFPDLQQKQLVRVARQDRDPSTQWSRRTEGQVEHLGSFGEGRHGAGPTRVEVTPEQEETEQHSAVRSVDPSTRPQRSPKEQDGSGTATPVVLVDYFKLLTAATKHVTLNAARRLGGVPPDSDSVPLTDQPSPTNHPTSWTYVWEGEIVRSRRARIVEFTERRADHQHTNPKYMYLLELERFEEKGRASLIVRGEQNERVEDQLLIELVQQAVELQGQWRTYDKEAKMYKNRVHVTGLRLTVLKHHWQEDPKRFAKAIQRAWATPPTTNGPTPAKPSDLTAELSI